LLAALLMAGSSFADEVPRNIRIHHATPGYVRVIDMRHPGLSETEQRIEDDAYHTRKPKGIVALAFSLPIYVALFVNSLYHSISFKAHSTKPEFHK